MVANETPRSSSHARIEQKGNGTLVLIQAAVCVATQCLERFSDLSVHKELQTVEER